MSLWNRIILGSVCASAVYSVQAVTTNTLNVAEGQSVTIDAALTAAGTSTDAFQTGDWIVKTGKGVLQATATLKGKTINFHIKEGVYELGKVGNDSQTGNPTFIIDSGATVDLAGEWGLFSGHAKVTFSGTGVGSGHYLGAICVGGGHSNPMFGAQSTFTMAGDATIHSYGSMNALFSASGSNANDPSTLDMNQHTLTIRNTDTSVFRPRWSWKVVNAGPIIVSRGRFSRHKTTNTINPHIPLMKFTTSAKMGTYADSSLWNLVDAFEFDAGTSIDKGSNDEVADKMTLTKVTGPVSISADATVTISKEFGVRGADLAAGNKLTAANTLTFASGCKLTATGLGDSGLTAGTVYTVAESETGITGTPTLEGDAAGFFTLANTGTALTLTVNDAIVGGLLVGAENAAHNTAALENIATSIQDGALVLIPEGDVYFEGDFDLSSATGNGVRFSSLGGASTIHATLKLGALQNVAIEGFTFKDCTGPALVATGTQGLKIKACTLTNVDGVYGTEGKKYPFAFVNVTDLEVTKCTYPTKDYRWDAPAYLEGGSQTEKSTVRADELVVYTDNTMGGTTKGWVDFPWYTNRIGLVGAAYSGLTLRKTGTMNATLNPGASLSAVGIQNVIIDEGQFVERADDQLGTAKSEVVVSKGACLCIAGGGESIKNRRVKFAGTGFGSENPAVRFTGSSAWNKASSITWELTDDATMYDNVANAGNGNFLWATFVLNGHTLTLTGKAGGVYRIGRSAAWSGGGSMVVKGVTVSASPVEDASTTPKTNFRVADGSHPTFIFRDKATFGPDTCELANLMCDLDFATPDCTFTAKSTAKIPHDFVFDRLAGAPAVNDMILSVSVTSNYTAHIADLQASKSLTLRGKFIFGAGATVGLDDPTAEKPSDAGRLVMTAAGGIEGPKPKPDATTAAAGWFVEKRGTTLYLRSRPNMLITIR